MWDVEEGCEGCSADGPSMCLGGRCVCVLPITKLCVLAMGSCKCSVCVVLRGGAGGGEGVIKVCEATVVRFI